MVMNTLALQTYEFIKELTAAGLTEQQAEIIAHHQAKIIDENLATKHDLELVRKEIEMLRKDMMLKLGTVIVAGFIAVIGIIIGVLPLMLN